MARSKISWFYESAAERKASGYESPKSSFGAYQKEGTKTIDEHFEDLAAQYRESNDVDIKFDMKSMMARKEFMEEYKTALMEPVLTGFRESSPNDPHIEHIIEQVQKFWDTKVRNYTESASMMGFLPIATLEFPVLLKQFFMSILKDIIEIESTKTPNITKHIRTTYLVDNSDGSEYEYPKCMFNGEWEKIWNAAKGIKIKEIAVPLNFNNTFDADGKPEQGPAFAGNPYSGRLHKFDIISSLTDGGVPGFDTISFQFKIIGIVVAGEVIRLRGNGITVEFSTNGTLVNGDLNFTHEGTHIEDTLGGRIDYRNGTIDISSSSGQVEGVIFSGYLSNEKNMRHVSVREKRDILRFTIEDGPRWNMPFTMEEIDDAAALMDFNYYNRMVDEIVRTQEMEECMTVIKFLNDEFLKYHNVETDIYKLESLAQAFTVDLEPPDYFAGDPFKYMATAVQFRLKALIHQITELLKMDNLSFVIVGNPMACQLIAEFVEWKSEQGSNIGGITVNNSYGFATNMGANVRVVATNLYDAYTAEVTDASEGGTGERELILHIYGYPTTPEHISFRHLKYTSHLFTSQSQTAYQSTNAPGGAYNIVTATSRFHTLAIQGIQGRLIMLNSARVYGKAPDRNPIVGAPWSDLAPLG